MKKIILMTLLLNSLIPLNAQQTAVWTDPEQLKKEPRYFTTGDIILPPGNFSLGKMFEADPGIKDMRSVGLDSLAIRFSYQNFANCLNLVVKKNSPQEKQLEEAKGKPVQLTFTLKQQIRMRGGVEPFTYYLGTIKNITVFDPKKLPVQKWGELRAFWKKELGNEVNVYLKIKDFAPEKYQVLKDYLLLDALADPGIEAGDCKYPGNNLNPAVPKDKTLYDPIMQQAEAAEGFCIARIMITSRSYKHPQYGEKIAGLGIVLRLSPLKTAADFGAPKILNTSLEKLDGSLLTDPVALTKTPSLFINRAHLVPGDIAQGEPFTKDKELQGYHTVNFTSLASNFRNNATGGDVVLAYKENTAIARTLASFPYQQPVILKFELKPRRRKLGGVLDLEYYFGEISDVRKWPRESWFQLRNDCEKLAGKDCWVYLQAMEQAEEKYQPFNEFILLNAKSTSQHSTGDPKYLSNSLIPALTVNGSENALLQKMAALEGFCRAKVHIIEKEFIPATGNKQPQKTHLAVIQEIQPMKTASSFGHESGNPIVKDDILRTWTPFLKITPSQRDLTEWFRQTEKKIKRRQYDDLSKKNDPGIAFKSKYRYKKGEEWVFTDKLPEFPAGERPYQIWEKGVRKVTRSNVSSFTGSNTITYVDYGPSAVSITTWYRLLFNEKTQAWEKPSPKATIELLKDLEKVALTLLPDRNKQVKLILDVEESKKLADLRNTIGQWTDTLNAWERSGSYNSPAGKKRITDERKKLDRKKIELKKLEEAYAEACKAAEPLDKSYQQLLDEAADFAEGKKELVGY